MVESTSSPEAPIATKLPDAPVTVVILLSSWFCTAFAVGNMVSDVPSQSPGVAPVSIFTPESSMCPVGRKVARLPAVAPVTLSTLVSSRFCTAFVVGILLLSDTHPVAPVITDLPESWMLPPDTKVAMLLAVAPVTLSTFLSSWFWTALVVGTLLSSDDTHPVEPGRKVFCESTMEPEAPNTMMFPVAPCVLVTFPSSAVSRPSTSDIRGRFLVTLRFPFSSSLMPVTYWLFLASLSRPEIPMFSLAFSLPVFPISCVVFQSTAGFFVVAICHPLDYNREFIYLTAYYFLLYLRYAAVIQLVEYLPSKQTVAGSSPVRRSNVKEILQGFPGKTLEIAMSLC